MLFTAADVFWIITGFSVPHEVIPKKMKKQCKGPKKSLMLLTGEKVFSLQTERVRQECKHWLFKTHVSLISWNLDEQVLKSPGAIEFFFTHYALEQSYLEIPKVPKAVHLSIPFIEEQKLMEINLLMKKTPTYETYSKKSTSQ